MTKPLGRNERAVNERQPLGRTDNKLTSNATRIRA